MGESRRYGWAVWLTRLLLLVVVPLIGVAFYRGEYLGVGTPVMPKASERWYLLMLQAPFAVAFLALLRGRSRFGLGLAAGAAVTLLVPLVPATLASIMFAGFTSGIPDRSGPLSLAALAAAAALLAMFALQALWAESPLRPFATGLAISVCWAMLFAATLKVADTVYEARLDGVHQSFREAAKLTDRIGKCAREFAGRHPERGFAADLAAIDADAPRCLPRMENGASGGFRFTYLASPPDERGVRASFSLCAQPLEFGQPGVVTVVVDSTDSGQWTGWPTIADTKPVACGVAWSELKHAASSLHFCLLSYAVEHPDQGFPAQLSDVDSCPRSPRVRAEWVYRAAPPNAEGRVVRYEATWDEGRRSFFTDETGVLRMAKGRTATAADMTYAEADRAPAPATAGRDGGASQAAPGTTR